MKELITLGIEDNTLVILMADNGPMTHNGPTGMVETLYRGGKGDFLEGGVRVTAQARWPGVIEDGQIEILEFQLKDSSSLIDQQLKSVKFPKQSLVASILRGDEVIVPRGAETLQAGDTVIVIAQTRSNEAIHKLFQQ